MSYLLHQLPPTRNDAVDKCLRALAPIKNDFNGIVVTGLSGITIGSIVAYFMDKTLTIIRKPHEECHGNTVEGPIPRKYIILDDFISSGDTIIRIMSQLKTTAYFAGITDPIALPINICVYDHSVNIITKYQWKVDRPFDLEYIDNHPNLLKVIARKGVK